jgi:hypothetical protein
LALRECLCGWHSYPRGDQRGELRVRVWVRVRLLVLLVMILMWMVWVLLMLWFWVRWRMWVVLRVWVLGCVRVRMRRGQRRPFVCRIWLGGRIRGVRVRVRGIRV